MKWEARIVCNFVFCVIFVANKIIISNFKHLYISTPEGCKTLSLFTFICGNKISYFLLPDRFYPILNPQSKLERERE